MHAVRTNASIVKTRCTPQHMYSTTYAGCSPQHIPTTYQGTYIVGVCCGQLYMLWVSVVGNMLKNGTCSPQHIICCGEHVYVVDNIREHVIHNIGKCCPQHTTHNITRM